MIVCQWHLDIPYGAQGEVVRILKEWGADKLASSGFSKARSARILVGHVGASPSHVVDEYEFESLADFEAALADMAAPRFRKHSEALAPFVVPGSQQWRVFRVVP